MTTYRVTAEHTPRGWWVLEAKDIGAVSQVRRLDRAAEEMREAIAYLTGVQEGDVDIDVVPILPDAVQEAMERSAQLRAEAHRANHDAAEESRRAAKALAAEKYTMRDIGAVMGVSHQRAQQLVKS